MRVIGVIDVQAGRAVHAVRGQRARYEPVQMVAGVPIDSGDPVALCRAYANQFGLSELYVADLDGIAAGAPQDGIVSRVAACTDTLWLDRGVTSVDEAHAAIAAGAHHVIVGLETLADFDVLTAISLAIDHARVAFSLDLREGQPILRTGAAIAAEPADVIAQRAVDAGAGAIVVLDLARVGTGTGLDLALIGRVRDLAPGVTLLAGGGVAVAADLARLASVGCDAALVASALQSGKLRREDLHANVTR